MELYKDKNHEFNSSKYHTGKKCITKGCDKPAGTYWSEYWCVDCNIKRIDRINNSFDDVLASMEKIENILDKEKK